MLQWLRCSQTQKGPEKAVPRKEPPQRPAARAKRSKDTLSLKSKPFKSLCRSHVSAATHSNATAHTAIRALERFPLGLASKQKEPCQAQSEKGFCLQHKLVRVGIPSQPLH